MDDVGFKQSPSKNPAIVVDAYSLELNWLVTSETEPKSTVSLNQAGNCLPSRNVINEYFVHCFPCLELLYHLA
jgi:hypothetical protein